jgi:Tol biopolymer transport system component
MTETESGMVLGTAAYMSPEQTRGLAVDKRTDIWAFGCVLYEMLTGRPAFGGVTVSDTIAAILEREPNWELLPQPTPVPIRSLLRHCLQKDRTERLRDIGDARPNLDQPSASGADRHHSNARFLQRLTRATGLAVLVAALGAAVVYVAAQPTSLDTRAVRYTPFATDPHFEGYPAWSPDGRSIAYLADLVGERHILVRGLDAAVPTRVTTTIQNPSHIFWSHDSTRIYYSRAASGIWSVSVAGGEPQRVLEDARIAAMSPDGGTLAFLRGRGGNTSLWFSPTDDFAPVHYRTAPFPEAFTFSQGLAFSPNGRNLAVLLEPRERAAFETELWVVPTSSDPPRRARDRVPHGFEHARVSWTADNRHVVLGGALAGRGNMDLYVVDAASGLIYALTSGVTEAVSPSVSPDGNRIAFASGTDAADLMHVNLDGSEIRTLLASARDERDPSWSPNGAQVAYVTNARGTPEIWLRSIREGWSAPVVRADSTGSANFRSLGRPVFSPDGQRLAYDVLAGTHGIWVSSISGGQAVPLDNQSSDQHSPSWSPDGEWVAYQRLRDKQWELVKVPVSGGAPVALADANAGGGPHIAWSPSGEWIAQTIGQTLRLVSADGARKRNLGRGSPAFAFSRDGALLHALRRSATDDWELATFVVATGVEQRPVRLDLSPNASVSGFSLHPDGTSFATSVAIPRYDIWLIEGFKTPGGWFRPPFW